MSRKITGVTIYRENGFTLEELIKDDIYYENCKFILGKDAKYCLRYKINEEFENYNPFNPYLSFCSFDCTPGARTVGHLIDEYKIKPNYEIPYTKIDYLKRFPLVNSNNYVKTLTILT